MTEESGSVVIASEEATIRARRTARDVAEAMGFRVADVTRIVTAVSELARNVHQYAGEGEMRWRAVERDGRRGLEFVFEDDGPGIGDVEAALAGEFSTSDGMGRGLSGTRKLMDDIAVETADGEGTTVTIVKWR
ncbi:MAG: anti-sigma regulatory factor [Halobacteriales archaeon]